MAIAAFSVGGEDLSVNLVLTKGATMTGRAIFEGLASPPDRQILALEAIPFGIVAAASVVTNPPAGITRDGTFVMTDLVGLREFRVRSIPPGWTLKSLTLDGRSLLDGPIEFKGSEQLTGVVAVLTNRHSELTGTVVDTEKKPVRDYSLVVFPEDRLRLRNPGRWTRWTRPDQNGRFSIDDLPAGKYLAIALDDVDEAEWSTVEYLDRLRPRATPVTIVDGQKQTTTLELVGTP